MHIHIFFYFSIKDIYVYKNLIKIYLYKPRLEDPIRITGIPFD